MLTVLRLQEDRFAAGDGRYQLFQYLRARLCAYLAGRVRDFWMVQADTVWRENLFEHAGGWGG